MELPGRNRIIAGSVAIAISMGALVYGGIKIGKYSDIQSELLVKKVEAAYYDTGINSREDFELASKELTRGIYSVGFGLAGLVFGMVVGGTSTMLKFEREKKKKRMKSFSQVEGRFKIEGG